jgi:uncharacterized damage-inducible protein DinB
MTPEQATFLLNEIYLPQIANEHATTRRLIEALPHDKTDYKSHDRNMSAWELATHIVTSQIFFLEGIVNGQFAPGAKLPESVTTPEQLLEWDEENFGKALDKVKAMTPEQLAAPVDFFGVVVQPAVTYLGFMASHSIHHRGQLSTCVRPMGGKVPSIYGPSGDSKPAQASA